MTYRYFGYIVISFLLFFSVAHADVLVIRDDVVGGDCAQVGVWDATTKTCTTTADFSLPISLASSSITFDGAGKTLDVSSGNVVLISGVSNVTLKNLHITHGTVGVLVDTAPNITIDSVDVSLASDKGLYVVNDSHGLTMVHNSFHDNKTNVHININLFENNWAGLLIDTTNVVDGKPIYYFENIHDQVLTGLDIGQLYCVSCQNIVVATSTFSTLHNNSQIVLFNTASTTIQGSLFAVGSESTINIIGGHHINIIQNTINDTYQGISTYNSPYLFVNSNTMERNQNGSVYVNHNSDGAVITDNTFRSSPFTVIVNQSADALVVHNNFYDTRGGADIYFFGSANAQSSSPLPVGGNYYEVFDSPSEGCSDQDTNGVCDTEYIASVHDLFAWTTSFGWNTVHTSGNSNVLFIPGIEASRLYRTKRADEGVGDKRLWEPTSSQEVEELMLDDQGSIIPPLLPEYRVFTRDVIDEAYLSEAGPNIYKTFLSTLETLKTGGDIENYDTFAYDWRLALNDIISRGTVDNGNTYFDQPTIESLIEKKIRDLASTSKSGKVTIVAHSNGGLVTKALIKKLKDNNDPLVDKIDKIIFVAVPQVGTPATILALLHGMDQGIPSSAPFILPEHTARQFALNLPSAYNLIPSRGYFSSVDTPVVSFASSTVEWGNRFGTIDSVDTLHNFLVDTEKRSDPLSNNVRAPTYVHDQLLTSAEAVHDSLDTFNIPSTISVYQIAGWGVPTTLSGVVYDTARCFRISCGLFSKVITPEPEWTIDGDGTVVVPSALWMREGKRYWVDLKGYNDLLDRLQNKHFKSNHTNILEISPLLEFITQIIHNNTLDTLPQYISTTSPVAGADERRLIFELRGPVTINAFSSSGKQTGVSTTTRQIIQDIPDSYVIQMGDSTYLFTTTDSEQKIFITPITSGTDNSDIFNAHPTVPIEIRITSISGPQVTTSVLKDVPVSKDTTLSYTFSSAEGPSVIDVDTNTDGVIDSSIHIPQNGGVTFDFSTSTPPTTPVVTIENQTSVDQTEQVSAPSNGPIIQTSLTLSVQPITKDQSELLPIIVNTDNVQVTYVPPQKKEITITAPKNVVMIEKPQQISTSTNLNLAANIIGSEKGIQKLWTSITHSQFVVVSRILLSIFAILYGIR